MLSTGPGTGSGHRCAQVKRPEQAPRSPRPPSPLRPSGTFSNPASRAGGTSSHMTWRSAQAAGARGQVPAGEQRLDSSRGQGPPRGTGRCHHRELQAARCPPLPARPRARGAAAGPERGGAGTGGYGRSRHPAAGPGGRIGRAPGRSASAAGPRRAVRTVRRTVGRRTAVARVEDRHRGAGRRSGAGTAPSWRRSSTWGEGIVQDQSEGRTSAQQSSRGPAAPTPLGRRHTRTDSDIPDALSAWSVQSPRPGPRRKPGGVPAPANGCTVLVTGAVGTATAATCSYPCRSARAFTASGPNGVTSLRAFTASGPNRAYPVRTFTALGSGTGLTAAGVHLPGSEPGPPSTAPLDPGPPPPGDRTGEPMCGGHRPAWCRAGTSTDRSHGPRPPATAAHRPQPPPTAFPTGRHTPGRHPLRAAPPPPRTEYRPHGGHPCTLPLPRPRNPPAPHAPTAVPAPGRPRPSRHSGPARTSRPGSAVRTGPPAALVGRDQRDRLRDRLAAVARGEAFLLHGGGCAETSAGPTADAVVGRLATLLQMAVTLELRRRRARDQGRPGCPAGTPSRLSQPEETRDGATLPVHRGGAAGGTEPTVGARRPDAAGLLRAYTRLGGRSPT